MQWNAAPKYCAESGLLNYVYHCLAWQVLDGEHVRYVRIVKIWRYWWNSERVTDRWYQCGDSCCPAAGRHGRRQTSSTSYWQAVEKMFSVVIHCIQYRVLGGLHSLVARSRWPQRSKLMTEARRPTSHTVAASLQSCFYLLSNGLSACLANFTSILA